MQYSPPLPPKWMQIQDAAQRCDAIVGRLRQLRDVSAPRADLRFMPEDPEEWSRLFADLLTETAKLYGLIVAAPFLSLSVRYVVVADAGALLVESSFCARRFPEAYSTADGIRWAVLDGMLARAAGALGRVTGRDFRSIVGLA